MHRFWAHTLQFQGTPRWCARNDSHKHYAFTNTCSNMSRIHEHMSRRIHEHMSRIHEHMSHHASMSTCLVGDLNLARVFWREGTRRACVRNDTHTHSRTHFRIGRWSKSFSLTHTHTVVFVDDSYLARNERLGGWGRDPFSRNFMKPTPSRKWYLTTGRRFH